MDACQHSSLARQCFLRLKAGTRQTRQGGAQQTTGVSLAIWKVCMRACSQAILDHPVVL